MSDRYVRLLPLDGSRDSSRLIHIEAWVVTLAGPGWHARPTGEHDEDGHELWQMVEDAE